MIRRPLSELTLKDNFLFAAVMMYPKNCKKLLELVLGREIQRVEVDREKSLIYNPDYKGVRLDVFAKDENNTHFNVEMQVRREHLERRARYYHSHMEMLFHDADYRELPDSYVIFLCDFDPFYGGKYCYTIGQCIREAPELGYDDGSHTIILSTKGRNAEEVSPRLVKFLQFLSADLDGSEEDYGDEYISELQKTIQQVKTSREMGERYMLFEEMLKDERAEGRAEGRTEGMFLQLIKMTCNMRSRGKAAEQIAEELGEDYALIESICIEADAFAPAYDAEQIYEVLKEQI